MDKEQEGGTYEIEFYAGELPEGVYIYHINASDFNVEKKMEINKAISIILEYY